jgi:hypothetical protein
LFCSSLFIKDKFRRNGIGGDLLILVTARSEKYKSYVAKASACLLN